MNSISRKRGQVKSVYLAGRISQMDWRHDIAKELRGAIYDFDPQRDGPMRLAIRSELRLAGGPTHISGPYFIASDHGGFHGPTSHGVGADTPSVVSCNYARPYPNPRAFAVQRCMTWLRDSDAMYVWVGRDFEQAHGTHVEMGAAHAMGIPIYAAIADDAFVDSVDSGRVETWFPLELARSFPAEDPVSGFATFTRKVAENR